MEFNTIISFSVKVILVAVIVLEIEARPKIESSIRNEVFRGKRDTDMCVSVYNDQDHREVATVGTISECPFQVCEEEIESEGGKIKVPSIVCLDVKDNCYQVYKSYNVLRRKGGFQIRDKQRVPMGCVYSTQTPGSSSEIPRSNNGQN
jgi:hypothetical protein